jgi:stress-induced morphogen
VVAVGMADCPDGAASIGGGTAAAGAVAAGLEAGVAIALTALRHGADSFDSFRSRHSKASLPPGRTLAQFAMKSERQEARTASRCAWVGCCAAVGARVSMRKAPAAGVQQAGLSCRSRPLPAIVVLVLEVGWRRQFSGEPRMPMAASDIERLIRARIPDAEVTIRDLAGDGDHYAATVIAESFRGKSRVQQHQIVYEALKAEMGGKLHALALQTGTPER